MYQAKTFDWAQAVNGFVKVMRNITDNKIPIFERTHSADHGAYPFIVYEMKRPPALYQSTTRNHEVFDRVFVIDCWAETSGEANAISDDLETLLHDVKYREQLKSYGMALSRTDAHNSTSDVLAPFLQASEYGFDAVVQMERHYESDYPIITDFKENGGSNNGDTNK